MSLWATLTIPFRRGPRRPLASRKPERIDRDVPLGMEGLDLDAVNAANRRNNALERVTSASFGRNRNTAGLFLGNVDTDVPEMPEDETYAARYFRAFQTKDVKDD